MIIREKDKEAIIEIAQSIFQTPLEILAYGSRVNGKAHSTSDLDLVVRTYHQKELDSNELLHFKKTLRESNIPIIVQVLDWGRIPESFHENIMKNYEVLTKLEIKK